MWHPEENPYLAFISSWIPTAHVEPTAAVHMHLRLYLHSCVCCAFPRLQAMIPSTNGPPVVYVEHVLRHSISLSHFSLRHGTLTMAWGWLALFHCNTFAMACDWHGTLSLQYLRDGLWLAGTLSLQYLRDGLWLAGTLSLQYLRHGLWLAWHSFIAIPSPWPVTGWLSFIAIPSPWPVTGWLSFIVTAWTWLVTAWLASSDAHVACTMTDVTADLCSSRGLWY